MNTNKMLRLKKLLRSVILAMLLLSAQIPPQVLAAVINGTDGPDTITGTGADDTIYAWGGNDTVNAGNGDDIIYGGSGNDILNGENHNDTIYGEDGDDTLNGGNGNDTLNGGEGNDVINGGGGTDTVVQTANADMTLTNTQLTGQGTDTLNSIERAVLTGGAGNNTLNASAFSGQAFLYGMGGDDTLMGGAGNDTLNGGDGTDTVVQTANADMTLTNTQLTGQGTDTLNSIERAILTGGVGNNTLNASTFSGQVYLYGLAGNDTLRGGSGDDFLDGGEGSDVLYGGGGTDTVVQTANADMTLTNTQLTGQGTDSLNSIERAILTGGAGNNILNASAFSGSVVLNGMGGNDTLMGGAGDDTLDGGDGTDTVVQTVDADMTLTNTSLIGMGNDILISIEQANLTGGASNNVLNASAFTGPVFLYGMGGDDTLMGGAGNDTLDGGDGQDTVEQTADVDMTLTNNSLTGMGLDTLVGIEMAALTGGAGNNTLNASAFSGSVFLTGGAGDDILMGGAGDDTLDGGDGTDTVVQTVDADMTLTDTSLTGMGLDTLISIEIAALTGGASSNLLDASAFSGQAFLYGMGGNDTLLGGAGDDTLDGGDGIDTVVQTIDADMTLTDTSLTGMGLDTLVSIEMAALTGGAGHNVINASGFSGQVNIEGDDGDDTLMGGAGNDTLDGGDGTDTVIQVVNANMTLTDNSLTGMGLDTLISIEIAALTGGAGNNILNASAFSGQVFLYGMGGNDTLMGGEGDDTLDGGDGVDTVVQTIDNDMTLTDTSLTGMGNDTLISIERAELTGGASDNLLDASAFSGQAFLYGMGGDDTLMGGAGNDTLDGGDGTDTVEQTADANMTLTNTSLTGMGLDTLISIEIAALTGGAGNNTLNASAFTGSVFLYGMGGNDILMGGFGNDILEGGSGMDTVMQTANADMTLTDDSLTGMGTDSLDSIERAELIGGAGNNKLDASAFSGQVVLSGMGGDDILMGGEGDDTLDGGDGTDTVVQTIDYDMALTDTSLTGMGNDTLISIERAELTGGASDNILDASAFSGQVFLYGMGGDDILIGGAGNDILDGGDGMDTVEQTADVDMTLTDTSLTGMGLDTLISIEMAVLTGGAGNNILNALGFSGPVILNGGAGDDTLIGGIGDDELVGGDGTDNVVQEVDADMILTDDSLTGMGTDYLDSIERARLIGGAGNNSIDASGFSGQAYLDGGDGDDTLVGGDGDDTIIGGNGNDTITTSFGQDTIIGGEGDDTFLFSGETGSAAPTVVSGGGGFNLFKFLAGASGRVELDTTSDEDTLDFSEYDGAVAIDLALLDVEQNVGYNSAGEDLFITLKGWFKRLIGSAFDDVLLGNDLENEIYGGTGDDQLDGRGGHDLLDGGPGIDTDLDKGDGDTWVNMELPLDPVDDDDDDGGLDDGGGTSTAQFLVPGLIPVTGTLQPLICDAGSNVAVLTTLTGDQVYFKNLCGMQAIVQPAASLPALLPNGRQIVSALSVVIADAEGKVLQQMPPLASITIAFKQTVLVNGGAEVLSWNGTGWVTLISQANGGFIEVEVTQGGLYVLTTR